VSAAVEPKEIEDEAGRPRTDRDIGQCRVERMPQPDTVEHVLGALARRAAESERRGDPALHSASAGLEWFSLADDDRVQPIGDRANRIQHHAQSLQPERPARPLLTSILTPSQQASGSAHRRWSLSAAGAGEELWPETLGPRRENVVGCRRRLEPGLALELRLQLATAPDAEPDEQARAHDAVFERTGVLGEGDPAHGWQRKRT